VDNFKQELLMVLVTEIAKRNAQRLMSTHPVELIKFLTKERTVKGAEDATTLLLKAAIVFVLKTMEGYSPEETDNNLTEFLVEFMEKRS
jgi:hypothetical protein